MTHRDELLAFVSSRLNSSMEAEDIVQNVFLRLLTTDKMITAVPTITVVIPPLSNMSIISKAYAVTRFRWNRCSLPERSWRVWNVD